jgi:hypothetical protein
VDKDKANNEFTASEGALDRASRERMAWMARQSAAANGGLGADFDPALYIEETPVIDLASGEQRGGRRFINTSSAALPNLKLRQVITDYARKNKIPIINTTKQQQALGLIQDARENTAGVYSRIAPILAQEGGWARAKNSMMNAAAGAFQLGERGTIVSGYKAYRTAAIASIQAIATLGPGLRINQAEINAAMKYDIPTEFDTDAVALEKISVFNEMLDHAEKTLLGEVVDQKDVRRVIQRSIELGKAKPSGPGKPVDDGWSPPDERVPVGAHSRAPRSR